MKIKTSSILNISNSEITVSGNFFVYFSEEKMLLNKQKCQTNFPCKIKLNWAWIYRAKPDYKSPSTQCGKVEPTKVRLSANFVPNLQVV